MKIKTEKSEFVLPIESKFDIFTNDLYDDLDQRLVTAAYTLGIKELASIALAVKAVKKNTGSLDDYLINIVEVI